jgi:hypothetical protein
MGGDRGRISTRFAGNPPVLVDLDAPGAGLLLGQGARREVVPLAAEPEGAESAVALLALPSHRRVPLRKRRESALLAENHLSN